MLQIVVDDRSENPALHAVIRERRQGEPKLLEIFSAGEQVLVAAR
jgi:hypothetical protein